MAFKHRITSVCVVQKSDSASIVPSGFLPNPVCVCKYRQNEWVFF